MTCNQLINILKAETPDLEHEMELNQYYLGLKEHHPIPKKVAEQDYLEHYLKSWGKGFRDCFCHYVCSVHDCEHREVKK